MPLAFRLLDVSHNNNPQLLPVYKLLLIADDYLGYLWSLQSRNESMESSFILKAHFGDNVEIECVLTSLDYFGLIVVIEFNVVSSVGFGEMLVSVELE